MGKKTVYRHQSYFGISPVNHVKARSQKWDIMTIFLQYFRVNQVDSLCIRPKCSSPNKQAKVFSELSVLLTIPIV